MLPEKLTLLFGTRRVFEEVRTLSVRALTLLSTSASFRVMRPLVPLRHALWLALPAKTLIVGASFTGVTVIVTVNSSLASAKRPLEAVTVKMYSPPAVGVPERTPAPLRSRPGGRSPALTEKLPEGLPVEEVKEWE